MNENNHNFSISACCIFLPFSPKRSSYRSKKWTWIVVEYHDSHSAAISDPDRSIIKNWKYPEASETICFFWKTFFGLSPAGAYVLILGLLCGYPMGAKLAHDLYIDQQISRREGEYLLTFSCNASPAFIISYLSGILLKN